MDTRLRGHGTWDSTLNRGIAKKLRDPGSGTAGSVLLAPDAVRSPMYLKICPVSAAIVCSRIGRMVKAVSYIYLFVALLFLGITALLYFAPTLKILNFVNYDASQTVSQINRYAAGRLLIPVIVGTACSYIVEMQPGLALALLVPLIMSILIAVIWIAAGVTRLGKVGP